MSRGLYEEWRRAEERSMEKKIAILLSTVPEWGGGHQYAMILAECLKEISDFRFELIALCTNQFWRSWCENHNVSYFMIREITGKQINWNLLFPSLSKIYNMHKTELGEIVKREKIDALFISTQSYFPNLETKMIAPVHDLMHRYESRFSEVRNDYRFREKMFKCEAKYAECLLTDSELGRQQFIESYSRYMKGSLPHIVSLPFIIPAHIGKTNEEYVDVPDKYVFYPAQFWQHKNHINLIKAVQLLKSDIDDIHLVLVGSEKNCLQEIKTYIADNALEKNITILGFVSDGNISYLYKHAVALVMPSYFGPTNIPPLEAMALGCPVIVSNKYAMPEQVEDAGLLFNPDSPEEIAECIRQVWSDECLRENMVRKGYQRIKKYDKQHFKDKLLKVIETCLFDGEDM